MERGKKADHFASYLKRFFNGNISLALAFIDSNPNLDKSHLFSLASSGKGAPSTHASGNEDSEKIKGGPRLNKSLGRRKKSGKFYLPHGHEPGTSKD